MMKPCQFCGKDAVVSVHGKSHPTATYRLENGKPVCGACEMQSQPMWKGKIVFMEG